MTADLFGFAPPRHVFKDIRKQHDSVAEKKAELCLSLGLLCSSVPPKVLNGSINKTREWMVARDKAVSILGNKRSSIPELTIQIGNMRRFQGE